MKKHPFIRLLALPVLLWLCCCTACEKDPPPLPKTAGRVLELGTLKPIPGATVSTWGDCEGQVLGNLNCKKLETLTTDNNGHYQSARNDGFMIVNAEKEGYFSDSETEKVVLDGMRDSMDIVLPPFAWVKANYKNVIGMTYGFYPNSNGTGQSLVVLSQGEIRALPSYLSRGNQRTVFGISVKVDSLVLDPVNNYWPKVEILVNGKPVPLIIGLGGKYIEFIPTGHDTTDIQINY